MASATNISKRLALSYILDWIIIIAIAAVGAGFWKVNGNHRPFSPVDPNISFPYVEHEKISNGVLFVVSLVGPAIITALIALVLIPGPTVPRGTSKPQIWKYKLWELNTAWMGLALGLAVTFFFTEGLKNLIGKPRPDLLSRCNLDPATVQQYPLGGEGDQLPLWNLLISSTACRQPDPKRLNDGFASFPSGHSSFSWAGMFYLALYLCSKFSITVPYLLPYSYSALNSTKHSFIGSTAADPSDHSKDDVFDSHDHPSVLPRKQAAAPPAYLFILPLIPISVATYIASTRYSDFRHHGFDIIFGSLMGILTSSISFRMYHMPIRRGAGWSWGPRSLSRAFGVGVGVQGYAEHDAREYQRRDLENGHGPRNAALAGTNLP